MRAGQLRRGGGGGPRGVSLPRGGTPFCGGTPSPAVARHGLPGFPRVLEAVARAHRERPADVAKSVQEILSGLARFERAQATERPLDATLPPRAAEALLAPVDPAAAGPGGAPKSPHASAR